MPGTPITISLSDAALIALDRHIRASGRDWTRADGLSAIVEGWLASQVSAGQSKPDEGMPPEDLNASNDD